jgi:hypothetical protein
MLLCGLEFGDSDVFRGKTPGASFEAQRLQSSRLPRFRAQATTLIAPSDSKEARKCVATPGGDMRLRRQMNTLRKALAISIGFLMMMHARR